MRVTPWHKPPAMIAPWVGQVLVEADAHLVTLIVRELEPRKARAFYDSDEAHAVALDAICRQQEKLLMDIGERIISEVRASRNGQDTVAEYQNPALDPYTLPLTSLADINTTGRDTVTALSSVSDTLVEIKALLEAQSGGNLEDVAGKLDTVIMLLGAL